MINEPAPSYLGYISPNSKNLTSSGSSKNNEGDINNCNEPRRENNSPKYLSVKTPPTGESKRNRRTKSYTDTSLRKIMHTSDDNLINNNNNANKFHVTRVIESSPGENVRTQSMSTNIGNHSNSGNHSAPCKSKLPTLSKLNKKYSSSFSFLSDKNEKKEKRKRGRTASAR